MHGEESLVVLMQSLVATNEPRCVFVEENGISSNDELTVRSRIQDFLEFIFGCCTDHLIGHGVPEGELRTVLDIRLDCECRS